MSGVSTAGFTPKTVDDLEKDLIAALLANVDPGLDVSPDSPIGQIVGIFAKKLAELWELGSTAYNAFDPDAAEGFLLQSLCSLTGTVPLAPLPSTVECTVNLNAGVTLPTTAMANVTGQPDNRWTLLGPTGALAGDTPTAVANTTGSAANYGVVFQSVENGVFAANSGTLTTITAPISGWNSITNAADASPGTLGDTDTTLRQRREAELSAQGQGTVDAIRADLLTIQGVQQVFVFSNDTDATNTDGLPPHSFEAVIWDGASHDASDADLAATIWGDKPSGVAAFGSFSQTVTDSAGATQTVRFSRAAARNVYLEFDITTDSTYPSGGAALVKAAVVAKAATYLTLGQDVTALVLRAAALNVQGVTDCTAMRLGFSSSPTGTVNLAIAAREIAVVDTSRILVNGA